MFNGLIKIIIPATDFWQWGYEQLEADSENGLINEIFEPNKSFYSTSNHHLYLHLGENNYSIPNADFHNFLFTYFDFKEDFEYMVGVPYYVEESNGKEAYFAANVFISSEDLDNCNEREYLELERKLKAFNDYPHFTNLIHSISFI